MDYEELMIGDLMVTFTTAPDTQCFQVAILNDSVIENNEDFRVLLFPGMESQAAILSSADSVTVTITDTTGIAIIL